MVMPQITRLDVWKSIKDNYPRVRLTCDNKGMKIAARERIISMLDLNMPLNHHEEKIVSDEVHIFSKSLTYQWQTCHRKPELFAKKHRISLEKNIFVPEYYEYVPTENVETKRVVEKPNQTFDKKLRDRSTIKKPNKFKSPRKKNVPKKFLQKNDTRPSNKYPIDQVVSDFESEGYFNAAYVVARLYENPRLADSLKIIIDRSLDEVSKVYGYLSLSKVYGFFY